jgi:hypothetical protein
LNTFTASTAQSVEAFTIQRTARSPIDDTGSDRGLAPHLQDGIELLLNGAQIAHKREVPLGGRQNLIDFLIEPDIGLEVKIKGGLSEVTRQLYRYAESDKITHLILVTSQMRHRQIPSEMVNKPLTIIHLIGSVF